MNLQRNYVGNEFHDLYKAIFQKGEEHQWPNKDDVVALVLRQGMNDGDATQEAYLVKMVNIWDNLMVKVAGVDYW